MKLLAFDTSSKAGALVALEWDPQSKAGWDDVRLIGEWTLNVDLTHSERLLWGVHQLLESARWTIEDVDVFGVGVGPGSFTGLRIGVTTARTLAHALNKPLIRVSSLAAMTRPVANWLSIHPDPAMRRTIVIGSTDACKGELFAIFGSARSILDCVSLAEGDLAGLWKRGVEEQVLKPEDLMKAVKRKLAEGGSTKEGFWVAVGEGRRRYSEAWKLLPAKRELQLPQVFFDQVQGRYLGLLVWEAYQAGLATDPLGVHPRYLRASDAELKLKAGLLPPGPTRGH